MKGIDAHTTKPFSWQVCRELNMRAYPSAGWPESSSLSKYDICSFSRKVRTESLNATEGCWLGWGGQTDEESRHRIDN